MNLDKEVIEFLEEIISSGKDNERMMDSIIGKSILLKAKNLMNKVNRQLEIDVERDVVIELFGNYVVDRECEEDVKYEGLKEMKVFEGIGSELLRYGGFEKGIVKGVNGVENHNYRVRIIKKK